MIAWLKNTNKKITPTSVLLFILPIIVAISLFAFLNLSCQSSSEDASGSLKLLYTSEVGGSLDPCG